jgi:hypothetical protein
MSIERKAPEPIAFTTGHAIDLLVQAVEDRIPVLEGLAKKNEGEGYHTAAKSIAADAAALKAEVLPLIRKQVEMPLTKAEDIRRQIKEHLAPLVRPAVMNARTDLMDPKKTKEEQEELFRNRADRLLDTLAVKIETYATSLAEESFYAGRAARNLTPQRLAMDSLVALKDG